VAALQAASMVCLQLPLERLDRRRVQETEGHRAVLAFHRVVHAVGLVEALQVAAFRHVAEGPAPVHQAVVGNEVQEAIGRHAGADPFERMVAAGAGVDQGDGDAGEDHGVQVVLLEPPVARFVVRLVPAPAEAMHDVLVRDDGKDFHRHDGEHDNRGIEQHFNDGQGNGNDSSLPWRTARTAGISLVPAATFNG